MRLFSARTGTVFSFLAIGLTIAMAVTGMGFGLWVQQFTVVETVNTGNCLEAYRFAGAGEEIVADCGPLGSARATLIEETNP